MKAPPPGRKTISGIKTILGESIPDRLKKKLFPQIVVSKQLLGIILEPFEKEIVWCFGNQGTICGITKQFVESSVFRFEKK